MSAVSEFVAKMTAFQDRQDTAMADLQGDVDNLNEQIAAAKAAAVTPEEVTALDGVASRAAIVSDKLDALDALTPPKAPPVA